MGAGLVKMASAGRRCSRWSRSVDRTLESVSSTSSWENVESWLDNYFQKLVVPDSQDVTRVGIFLRPHLNYIFENTLNFNEFRRCLCSNHVISQSQSLDIADMPNRSQKWEILYNKLMRIGDPKLLLEAWKASRNIRIVLYLIKKTDNPQPDVVRGDSSRSDGNSDDISATNQLLQQGGYAFLSKSASITWPWDRKHFFCSLLLTIVVILLTCCGCYGVYRLAHSDSSTTTTQVPQTEIPNRVTSVMPTTDMKSTSISPIIVDNPFPLASDSDHGHHQINTVVSSTLDGVCNILVNSVSDIFLQDMTDVDTVNVELTQPAASNFAPPLVHSANWLRIRGNAKGVKNLNILGHLTIDWLLFLLTHFDQVIRLHVDVTDFSDVPNNFFDTKNNQSMEIELAHVTTFSIHGCKDVPVFSFILGLTMTKLMEVNICSCDLMASSRIRDKICEFLNRNKKILALIDMSLTSPACPGFIKLDVSEGDLTYCQKILEHPCLFVNR